jgi:hypothetical protein
MLPAPLMKTFQSLLSVETQKLDEQTRAGVTSQVSMCAGRGALQSSAACQLVVAEASKSIPIRAQTALNLVVRCLAAHSLPVDAATRDDAVALLNDYLDHQQQALRATAQASAPFRSTAAGPEFLSPIDRATQLERDRLAGELDLMVAAVATRSESRGSAQPGATTIAIHGPVGVVQTGPGSYGTAHQHIDAGAREALEKAIGQILDRLADAPTSTPFDIGEIRQMAEETRAELQSSKPNASKLRALVAGTGSAIAYAPHLKEAYDTLKWAAAFLGINLP